MYRHKLPVGAQFRSYEVPVCAGGAGAVALAVVQVQAEAGRWGVWRCILAYLAAALLLPRAGA